MFCSNCKKEIDDNNAFCPNCGQATKKEKNCPICGKDVHEQAVICVGCGASLQPATKPSQETNPLLSNTKNKSKNFIISIICGLISIILLFVPGSFKYIFESDFIYQSQNTMYGSFKDLISRTNADFIIMGILIFLILTTVLIHIISKFSDLKIRIIDIFTAFFSLVTYVFFFLVGAATFTNYSTSTSPIYGKITQNHYFSAPGIVFFVEILLLIALIVLSVINAKQAKKHSA